MAKLKNPPTLVQRTPQQIMSGLSRPDLTNQTNTQTINGPRAYTTPGGMGGQGTQLPTGGYSYSNPTNLEGLTGTRNPYSKMYDMTGLGETMDSGMQYAYTDPSGAQQYAMLDASQLDAINNPTQGSEGLQGTTAGSGLGGVASGIAGGLGAAAQLANAYLGYKNYGLAKEKFRFEKAAANRAIANQASEYNTGLQNRGEVGMALAGNTMDPNARGLRQAQMDTQKISTAAIG